MVHTNNLRYMGMYRGPIKGQIGLYKGQKGQISYLIEITSLTLHWRCVFSQEKWLSYYSINLVNCFHQKKAKWAMNEGQKGQIRYLIEVESVAHHWRCVFLNKNDYHIILLIWSIAFIKKGQMGLNEGKKRPNGP